MRSGRMTTATVGSSGERKATQDMLFEIWQAQREEMTSNAEVSKKHVNDYEFDYDTIKVLKIENARLKRLLVEAVLEVASLREVLQVSGIANNDAP